MTEFDLKTYDLTLLRLYRKNNDEVERLMNELEYYMLETTEKDKYLYLVAANKFDIYIVWNKLKTNWSHDKIGILLTNSLKETTYMHAYMNGYKGLMDTSFWEELKDVVGYYKNTKKFRKALLKKEAEEEMLNPKEPTKLTIDDVLNKINDSGIDSLTEEERKILKNYDNENN